MQRRTAIKTTLAGLGGLALFPRCNTAKMVTSQKDRALGVQLFTVPKMVDEDLGATLSLMGEIGYKEVEFFGPYPFSSAGAKESFRMMQQMIGLKDHAFYGHGTKEVKQMLKTNGLVAPSLHTNILTLREGLTEFLDGAAEFSPKYAVIPALMEGRDTLADYERLADEFNEIGLKMSKYGMQLLYHNHGYEHAKKSGKVPLEVLLENTDKNYVQFELDIFWMSAAGASPVDYLTRYPGRFKALHVKDASEQFRFSGDGSNPQEWMAGFPKMADPGEGVFDIANILKTGQAYGVDHFFLERDMAPQPEETLRNSFVNLRGME